jgi:hypothetical protein
VACPLSAPFFLFKQMENQLATKDEILAVLKSKGLARLAEEYRQDQTVTVKDLLGFSKEDWKELCLNTSKALMIFNKLHPQEQATGIDY